MSWSGWVGRYNGVVKTFRRNTINLDADDARYVSAFIRGHAAMKNEPTG
jgi:hypothetical protein